jgi:hypothetical protein
VCVISPTIRGSRYFIIVINHLYRKSLVYFMKLKSNALKVFKMFVSKFERKTTKKVKAFRSDKGGEYFSKYFDSFCKSSEIIR